MATARCDAPDLLLAAEDLLLGRRVERGVERVVATNSFREGWVNVDGLRLVDVKRLAELQSKNVAQLHLDSVQVVGDSEHIDAGEPLDGPFEVDIGTAHLAQQPIGVDLGRGGSEHLHHEVLQLSLEELGIVVDVLEREVALLGVHLPVMPKV